LYEILIVRKSEVLFTVQFYVSISIEIQDTKYLFNSYYLYLLKLTLFFVEYACKKNGVLFYM